VDVNLPNAITVARIAVAPAIVWLIVLPSWPIRLAAWILYLAAAITDYYDGKLARSRNLVTDLGRLLDPLADKLLLVCTLGPMWWLMRGAPLVAPLPAADDWANPGVVGPVVAGMHVSWPVVTLRKTLPSGFSAA
jgi:phosphatidylglycerophosphate synthase